MIQMAKRTLLIFLLMLGMVFGLALTSQATLIDRGGGLIYDDDLNITWLQDANYAKTSGYDTDGTLTWTKARTWAENLAYYDSVRSVTYEDWRLPTTLQPDPSCSSNDYFSQDYGYNCIGSEMGHLFYNELEGTAGANILLSPDQDLSFFTNLQPFSYWSNREYPYIQDYAWLFHFDRGLQEIQHKDVKDILVYAWAVRDGDVSTVPEPTTLLLLGSGMACLIAWRKKFTA